ncbi:hypothetical protein LTV02_31580 [Nocardia yamanashiensis]|uniref:hypothetical protein n=1 Tax=Nocardia yamanashiensis TaxID=209247 RepID=UPI001E62DF84|nr:hypothetical protein [Nocardia yamanashiensis]UGT40504.1 hypothetical protein LTV02_31580 [Nocardia yamanashiensis]
MDEKTGGTAAPRFSTELLGELHAGLIPAAESEQLWPQVRRDPAAVRYLRSLDRVNDRLHELGRAGRIVHPMPDAVSARLERMIDDLATADFTDTAERVATVHQLHPDRTPQPPVPPSTAPMPAVNAAIFDTGRLDPRDLDHPDLDHGEEPDDTEPVRHENLSRNLRWVTAAAAAAAVIAGGVVAVDAMQNRTTAPATEQSAAAPALAPDFSSTEVLTAMGRHEITGPLASGTALDDCLEAAGLGRAVLGTRSVTYAGTQAVLVLLAGPKPPQITAAVLGNTCTPANPQLLANTDIG